MSAAELETKELLVDVYHGLGKVLGVTPTPLPQAQLLSRHWTVFQVPSATTPNYLYYVVGSIKDGFRCSCVGFQSSNRCYHAQAVTNALKAVAENKRKTSRARVRKAIAMGAGR